MLHTRIPAALEDEIKRLAEALSIPVSNLVRNILQDTVGMIATVKEHVGDAVTDLRAEVDALSSHVTQDRQLLRRRWAEYQAVGRVGAPPIAEDVAPRSTLEGVVPHPAAEVPDQSLGPMAGTEFGDVLGWQTLTLNVAAACALCHADLVPGAETLVGVGGSSPNRIIICLACRPQPGTRKET